MTDKETDSEDRESLTESSPNELNNDSSDGSAGNGAEPLGRSAANNSEDDGAGFFSVSKGRGDLWRRALFMVLFAVLYGVAEFVLGVVVIVQFVIVLFTGSANEQLLRLGSSLSIYVYQVFRFLTFTGDEQPFPLSVWPVDEVEDSPWFDSNR